MSAVRVHVGAGQLGFELLHGARADDRGGDRRVVDHEGDGQLDERQAGLSASLPSWSTTSSLRWLAGWSCQSGRWARRRDR
jgi:hypothetical protein